MILNFGGVKCVCKFLCVNKKKHKMKYTQVVSYVTSGITGNVKCILINF